MYKQHVYACMCACACVCVVCMMYPYYLITIIIFIVCTQYNANVFTLFRILTRYPTVKSNPIGAGNNSVDVAPSSKLENWNLPGVPALYASSMSELVSALPPIAMLRSGTILRCCMPMISPSHCKSKTYISYLETYFTETDKAKQKVSL